MDKKDTQQNFDFVFDAPTYSEFLPNKDMNYYNPLEAKINEKNELDQWFLVYHDDHYQNKSQKSRGKKNNKDQLDNKVFPLTRSKGDQLPKTKKRKQISTDEYQQKIEIIQSQQLPQKKQSKQIKRQTKNFTAVEKFQESIKDQQKVRRNSKDDKQIVSNQIKSIPERINRISSQSSSQVKRVTRSKSNSKDIKSFQEIPVAIKSLKQVKTEQPHLNQKQKKNQGQKMIVEFEQRSNDSTQQENTQETKKNGFLDQKLEVINEKQDADTIQEGVLQQDKRYSCKGQKQKDINSSVMEECPSSKASTKSGIQLMDNKVELTQNNNQNNNLSCNLVNTQINDSLFQNKSTLQLVQETLSQKNPNRQNKMIEEVDQATKQSDSSDSYITNIFNQIDTQINNQLLITPHKSIVNAEIKQSKKGSTPILSSHSRDDPSPICLQLQQKNEDIFQKSQRTRTNKNKLQISEDKNQLSQYKRHQSLNISKARKSIILDNSVLAISHKRKSEVVSAQRSKSIDEQKQDQQIKEFEKDWEKKNGVKLYMLNYQKRKEIKQLFLNQDRKDKVNVF
ncbi:hypothetical protein ABPG74_018530 [Tetrahymena malaccensis]